MKIESIDLGFMDTGEVIASFSLLDEDGASAALVETGPTNCLDRLSAGLKIAASPEDVRQVYLTHIHLDHAGASGHLSGAAQRDFLRARGRLPAPCRPFEAVKSATRIYGERMDELWGEARPVPEDRIKVLKDGEETQTARRPRRPHTPGHAYHHLAYLEPGSGALYR